MTLVKRISSEKRKLEIGQAALELAYMHAPENVSTGMIATRLGLTQPAIYKHYPTKQDIWREVSKRLAGRISDNVTHAERAGLEPVAALKQLVLSHLDLVSQNPALPELMTMRANSLGQTVFKGQIQTAMAEFQRELTRNVQQAIKDKVFHDTLNPQDAALLIIGVIQSSVLRMIVTGNPAILQKDGPRLLDLLLAGFIRKGEKL
ncbi:MAG: TetR/AcrR family transcriptional regulator [Rhodobacteraceae bacterium]|nr:TetR/AcrR family transcriptional regulator [Paracoccaceae bacterium]